MVHGDGKTMIRDADSRDWLCFGPASGTVEAVRLGDVRGVLREVDRAVSRGLWAVGFVAYEAGPAFDSAIATGIPDDFPLARFTFHTAPERLADPPNVAAESRPSVWQPSVSAEEYRAAVDRVREYIRAGDTYQVNYTFRLRTAFTGDPAGAFLDLTDIRNGAYGAYLDIGRWVICSASPELFFRLEGDRLISKPMKGTRPRGMTVAEDRELGHALTRSMKDRAENVMIVDMVRNDLGRVAIAGTVRPERLFAAERYATVWQMTSSVACRTRAGIAGIFDALFPPASITGAPKPRTTEIIRELETTPRRVYTGTVGYVAPGRVAQFNVAIRTVLVDRESGHAEYGIGSGIVWDSDRSAELEECISKARIIRDRSAEFSLLESLLWEPGTGYFLLERHIARMRDSASYFGFGFPEAAIRRRLTGLVSELPARPHKVRLLLDRRGEVTAEAGSLGEGSVEPVVWRVGVGVDPVDSRDPFLYHKTTRRGVYEAAARRHPEWDDVILRNERGEITESCRANLAVRFGSRWFTPPVACGLLGGTYRAELLALGELEERVISVADLGRADEVVLLNSVRRRVRVRLAESVLPAPG